MRLMRIEGPLLAVWLALRLVCPAQAEELLVPATVEGSVWMLVQDSPLAGSQFYALTDCWDKIVAGDELSLLREPANPHDSRAVRVLWREQMLGYVPRRENRAVSAALDRGDRLKARVMRMTAERNPWLRLRFAVFVEL